MLTCIKYNANCLIYTSDKLKNDKEIVLESVKQNKYCLANASDEVRNDKEFIL